MKEELSSFILLSVQRLTQTLTVTRWLYMSLSSAEAQAEARFLMLSANNLLRPQDGKPVTVPTQDMILGSYYLTVQNPEEPGAGKVFKDEAEALKAYDVGAVGLHAPIKIRIEKEIDGEKVRKLVCATVGQIIFNKPIPQDLKFVDRSDPEHAFDYEITFVVTKKELGKIINRCIQVHGITKTAVVLDKIKAQGYKYSTKGAITISVADMETLRKNMR